MTSVRLRYVDRFVDRTGKARHYFRRPRGPRIPLPGLPGSPEFMEAYAAALHGRPLQARPAESGGPGTIAAVVRAYMASAAFIDLKPKSKQGYRYTLERLCQAHGHRLIAEMQRQDVLAMLDEYRDQPGNANDLLARLRVLVAFALDRGLMRDDPTIRIRRRKLGEHHSWTDDELAAFTARWPVGTRERTAFALALYTGQRREDLAAMMWADIAGTRITVVQEKTGTRLVIPLHPELQDALRAWRRTAPAIFPSSQGERERMTASWFGEMVGNAIDAAGLPEACVLHGLRKAAARRLAEAGCTAHQIAAITGHTSLREIERYTRTASQERLAQQAMDRLLDEKGTSDSQTGIKLPNRDG